MLAAKKTRAIHKENDLKMNISNAALDVIRNMLLDELETLRELEKQLIETLMNNRS